MLGKRLIGQKVVDDTTIIEYFDVTVGESGVILGYYPRNDIGACVPDLLNDTYIFFAIEGTIISGDTRIYFGPEEAVFKPDVPGFLTINDIRYEGIQDQNHVWLDDADELVVYDYFAANVGNIIRIHAEYTLA